jgi:tetratricopeptide (TPR) repeat protein
MDAQASQVAAWALMESGDPEAAVRALQPNLELIPPSLGGVLFARALQSANQLGAAALQYQRVYFEFPISREAPDAGTALARLRQQLGDRFPPPLSQQILGRARILIFSGEAVRATAELHEALKELAGPERDQARVLLGVARYFRKEYQASLDYLIALEVAAADADAERLYYVVQGQRRLDRFDQAFETWQLLPSPSASAQSYVSRASTASLSDVKWTCPQPTASKNALASISQHKCASPAPTPLAKTH